MLTLRSIKLESLEELLQTKSYYTLFDDVPSNAVATGEKMIEPAVTSVFANVNLPLLTLFILAHLKCKYFFI